MTSNYPYPAIEHCELPATVVDVMRDEMRMYPNARELRNGTIAIGRIYKKLPLLVSFERYAQLATMINSGGEGYQSLRIEPYFYAGTILATHSTLKPAPKFLRQGLLHSVIFDADNMSKQELDYAVEEFAEFRATPWQELLEDQSDIFADCLIELSAQMFEDLPQATKQEDSFANGFMFAGYRILQTALETC